MESVVDSTWEMTMSVLLASAFSLVTLVGVRMLRPKAPAARRIPAPRSQRITNPRAQGIGIARVWQLHSNGCRCEAARALAGRRLEIDDTVPLLGQGGAACHCYYRPLVDARQAPRRGRDERREQLRFDLRGSDRRRAERRAQRNAWQSRAAHSQ